RAAARCRVAGRPSAATRSSAEAGAQLRHGPTQILYLPREPTRGAATRLHRLLEALDLPDGALYLLREIQRRRDFAALGRQGRLRLGRSVRQLLIDSAQLGLQVGDAIGNSRRRLIGGATGLLGTGVAVARAVGARTIGAVTVARAASLAL